jgi:hypothetical protein
MQLFNLYAVKNSKEHRKHHSKRFHYTGCLKIAKLLVQKKTVASTSPKKSKKPIFNFFKQKG